MGNIIGLDLNIDQDYLADAVKQTVMMGISESLNGKNEIVSQIVRMVLQTKVSDKGTISSYDRDNKYTLLEFYVRNMIREVTTEEMQKIVDEHREDIAKAIRTELAKKVNYNKFVDAFIGNISSAISNSWVPRIEVVFDQAKDY
jgi:hypothetical protein